MHQIPAQDIRAAGHSGVVNYVSLSRPGSSFGAKPITRPYAESLTAAGLVIVSNYQYGKPGGSAPSDFTRGFNGGVADAHTAWQLHTAAGGGQSAPIFFTVDDDINRDTWNNVALQWFRGINSVLGVQRTGVYGGINVCQWAAADGVIGNSRTAGHRWAWQTRSWSHGQVDPAAVLYQRIVSTASTPGPIVGGRKSTSTTFWPKTAASGTYIRDGDVASSISRVSLILSSNSRGLRRRRWPRHVEARHARRRR